MLRFKKQMCNFSKRKVLSDYVPETFENDMRKIYFLQSIYRQTKSNKYSSVKVNLHLLIEK